MMTGWEECLGDASQWAGGFAWAMALLLSAARRTPFEGRLEVTAVTGIGCSTMFNAGPFP
jgi:hypothetical protein